MLSLPHLAFSEDSIYGITGDSVLGFFLSGTAEKKTFSVKNAPTTK